MSGNVRTVGVVTTSRADYGLYRPVLAALDADPATHPLLFVGGMHLEPAFGETVREVEADGFEIAARVPLLESGDGPQAIAWSMGRGLSGFADAYAGRRPDVLVVLGDRFEMLSAAAAALPFTLPLAHIHGGESTEGLTDEQVRHAITKMAHLHFAALPAYARRIVQMGEEPWRVTVSGAPGLDNLRGFTPLLPEALRERFGVDVSTPPLLVTYHPQTLAYADAEQNAAMLLIALERAGRPVVATAPNADTHGRRLLARFEAFAREHPWFTLVPHLGTEGYLSLMAHAAAMVGNSSSGIIEAASFHLPVVNVGNRQQGRVHGANVLDCAEGADAITAAIVTALSPEHRAVCAGVENPYGDGYAAERIVAVLREAPLGQRLLMKRFHTSGGGAD